MKKERGWLVKIHCANHRVELAVKDVFNDSSFTHEIDPLYLSIYNIMKHSGKLKTKLSVLRKH